jgi:hypothetical protein
MPIQELLAGIKSKVAGMLGGGKEAEEKPAIQDGNAAPQGKPLSEAQQLYGPNFEHLEEKNPEVVRALQQCIMEYRMEALWSQRRRILRTRMAREFWNDIQYGTDWWAATDPQNLTGGGSIGPTAVLLDDAAGEDGGRFEYVTNWFRGYGESFNALMSQDVPNTTFAPRSRNSQEDITFAKAALDVVDLTERNNPPKRLLSQASKYFWTDGIVAGYVRYVVDGERFGYDEMPKMGLQNVGGMQVPAQVGTEKIPRGQEVITLIGGLESVVPIWADDVGQGARLSPEAPYLQWNCEPHVARLKSAFPHVADKIDADIGMTAEEVYERVTRLGVKQQIPYLLPQDATTLLSTFSRTWLRPWAFERLKDKAMIAELKKLYPEGSYSAFSGMTYCESRNEGVDKKWRVQHCMDGDGQMHPAAGQSLLDPCQRYNDLANLQMENIEFGVPGIYADSTVLNFDALANQVAQPAVHYPARAKPGMALADAFFQPEPAKEPVTLVQVMTELAGPTMQFLAGLPPAIWGGEMNEVKTASGYAQARDQAMGRLGLIRSRLVEFYNELQMLAVECFRENRPEDVEVPFAGETGNEKAKWIRLGELEGNIMIEPEPDDGMPRLVSQQRQTLEALFSSNIPPEVMKILMDTSNVGTIKSILGFDKLADPDEDARMLMMRRIQLLLESQPIQPQGVAPQPGPNGTIQMVQPQPTASLPLIDVFDNPIAEVLLAECCRWANDDPGQKAKDENPAGYQNVYLYAKSLAAVIAQKQQAQFQQAMALKHAPPKPPALQAPKGPSESINFKDMPPEGQTQMAEQAGIQLTPEQMQEHQDQQRQDKADELQAKLAAKPKAGVSE